MRYPVSPRGNNQNPEIPSGFSDFSPRVAYDFLRASRPRARQPSAKKSYKGSAEKRLGCSPRADLGNRGNRQDPRVATKAKTWKVHGIPHLQTGDFSRLRLVLAPHFWPLLPLVVPTRRGTKRARARTRTASHFFGRCLENPVPIFGGFVVSHRGNEVSRMSFFARLG